MEPKSILFSKVFWFNVVTSVIVIGGHLIEVMPDQIDAYIVPVVAAANVALRMFTTKPVSLN